MSLIMTHLGKRLSTHAFCEVLLKGETFSITQSCLHVNALNCGMLLICFLLGSHKKETKLNHFNFKRFYYKQKTKNPTEDCS